MGLMFGGVELSLAQGRLDRLVGTLSLHDEQGKAVAPDRIVGDVAVPLTGALFYLGGLHVFLGADPLWRDAHEARVDKERIDELLLHVALGSEFRNHGDGYL